MQHTEPFESSDKSTICGGCAMENRMLNEIIIEHHDSSTSTKAQRAQFDDTAKGLAGFAVHITDRQHSTHPTSKGGLSAIYRKMREERHGPWEGTRLRDCFTAHPCGTALECLSSFSHSEQISGGQACPACSATQRRGNMEFAQVWLQEDDAVEFNYGGSSSLEQHYTKVGVLKKNLWDRRRATGNILRRRLTECIGTHALEDTHAEMAESVT